MNPPAENVEVTPEKLEEVKGGGPLFHCNLYDTDIVYKIAQALLPGLASACVDNTTGGLLKSPASVAIDIRREMVDYLMQRSENFVVESVVLQGGPDIEISSNPFDVISDFVEDFASSKRNFFSRVSGWLLSESREDKIDDLAQEMEINGFWLMNRRESVAQSLLKNIDIKNTFHCSMKFKSLEELGEHKSHCGFRTVNCTNEGCTSRFSAAQTEKHDSICPFKILPCEQKCPDTVMRREMDRHCITICPMKLVKCPFYSVGCHATVPQCTVDQHKSENLQSHLIFILQTIHKEVSSEDLKERAEELELISSPGKLAAAHDARSLTMTIKDLEAKLGPLKVTTKTDHGEENTDMTEEKEESTGMATKDGLEESQSKEEEDDKSPSKDTNTKEPQEKEKLLESPANVSDRSDSQSGSTSISVQENMPLQMEDHLDLQTNHEVPMKTSLKERSFEPSVGKEQATSPMNKEEFRRSPANVSEQLDSQSKKEESATSICMQEKVKELPLHTEECLDSQTKLEVPIETSSKETSVEPSVKKEKDLPPMNKDELCESPVGSASQKEASNQFPSGKEHLKVEPSLTEDHAAPPMGKDEPQREKDSELAAEKESNTKSATEKESLKLEPSAKDESATTTLKKQEDTLPAPGSRTEQISSG